MSKHRIFRYFLLLFILLFVPIYTKAESSVSDKYKNLPYVINNYDINIKVNDNNIYDITETISVYNNKDTNDIYRYIPIINNNKLVQIYDVKTNFNNKITYVNSNYIIHTKTNKMGVNILKITYKYDAGNDNNNNKDIFNYNFIGNSWDTVIGNITFSISMPKEFDKNNIKFFREEKEISNEVVYSINDKTITGKYTNYLNSYKGLNINIDLENNYFNKKNTVLPRKFKLYYMISPLLLCIAYYLWNKYGRDEIVPDIIDYYPPKDMNSLELAYYLNGKIDEKDVMSLLVYLSNKGYINIIKENNKTKIVKCKDYDGENKIEKLFIKGLFGSKNEITKINKSFNKTIYRIINDINNTKDKIYYKNLTSCLIIIFMIMFIMSLTVVVPLYNYIDISNIIFNVVITLMFIPFLYIIFSERTNNIVRVIVLLINILLMYGFYYYLSPFLSIVITNDFFIMPIIINMLCAILLFIFLSLMPKRTTYGNRYLGEIRGFQDYIKYASLDDIKEALLLNNNYYYDILPYLYVLNIYDESLYLFANYDIDKPKWIICSGNFIEINRTLINLISDILDDIK